MDALLRAIAADSAIAAQLANAANLAEAERIVRALGFRVSPVELSAILSTSDSSLSDEELAGAVGGVTGVVYCASLACPGQDGTGAGR